jgi:TnpA family transposase
MKEWLTETAENVDANYPDNGQIVINENGEPTLRKLVRKEPSQSNKALEEAITQRLPERNILDILCNVEHWTKWTRHFGPLSGSDPKLENAVERYIITSFGYGCNLGPTQTSKHMRNTVTPHMLSFVNRRHINAQKIDEAIRDILNPYNQFNLPKLWGNGKTAAADGTKYDLYEENLLSEYHIRYGGYGGIAYHHVSDTYIALFSHFIPCGVWEAVFIIDGLLKNKSEIQPDTVHADTQGQSTPVFALAHLLGIKLMPRIRNWKDLKFFRPNKDVRYKHIAQLFKDEIDWDLLETHWQDLLQVVLSIKAGKVLPSTLLRKLNNYNKKNRLYQAFRELGRVVRTVFLLKYISDLGLSEQINASTNKVEA